MYFSNERKLGPSTGVGCFNLQPPRTLLRPVAFVNLGRSLGMAPHCEIPHEATKPN